MTAGTINPGEHGEVYVLGQGATETDQDLGIYERYLDIECTPLDYLTSGRRPSNTRSFSMSELASISDRRFR